MESCYGKIFCEEFSFRYYSIFIDIFWFGFGGEDGYRVEVLFVFVFLEWW